VSVIGNVDLQGDRVMPHAFDKSKEKWQKSGDPIPVIWSHEWGDPFAHIGWIDPNNIEEIGKTGALQGGLLVTGHLDVDKPFAKQVYDLLAARRVKEFSFAYDIPAGGEKRGKDGANELHELDIIEVGPTLKGANTETALLGVKTRLDRAARLEHAGEQKAGSSKPWRVEKRGDQYCVIKESDNSTVACHDTEDEANAQVRALYASEKSATKTGRVIGAKAAAALKDRLATAVDQFVEDINGAETNTGEKTVDEAIIELNEKLAELDTR